MNSKYEDRFQKWIAQPLRNVIGQPLLSVIYYVLHVDYTGFNINAPNAPGGCQGIRLLFSGGELELDWDWQSIFRAAMDDCVSPPMAYHLVARSVSERQATIDDWSGLRAVDATEGLPWKEVCGEPLLGATAWGVLLPEERYSPQAVALRFPSAQVMVAVGMTGDLSIGDGDEMLVFSEPEWTQRLSGGPLVPFWATAYPVAR